MHLLYEFLSLIFLYFLFNHLFMSILVTNNIDLLTRRLESKSIESPFYLCDPLWMTSYMAFILFYKSG